MVPGDTKRDDVFDLHPGKQPMDMATDEFLKKDEVVFVTFRIYRHKPWQDGGHFNEGVGLGHLYAARFLENNQEV